jgi:hypothetical protein
MVAYPNLRGRSTHKEEDSVKKILLLLSVCAVLIVLLAPAAFATQHGGTATATAMSTASPTATATASPTATATALPSTGGPELTLPVTLVASLALMGSGVGALALVQRSSASS